MSLPQGDLCGQFRDAYERASEAEAKGEAAPRLIFGPVLEPELRAAGDALLLEIDARWRTSDAAQEELRGGEAHRPSTVQAGDRPMAPF